MSHPALTITSTRQRAPVIKSWDFGLIYFARGQAAEEAFPVVLPKILATL
jgi:hypothetical protein